MKFYLMSYHGTLLCRLEGHAEPGQQPISAAIDRDNLVSVDLDPNAFRQSFAAFIGQESPTACEAELRYIGLCQVHPFPATRTIALSHNGAYAGLPPGGLLEINRAEVNNWEHFLPCSDEDLDFLQLLLNERWIIKSNRARIGGQSITVGANFVLRMGHLDVPLNYNLPVDQQSAPFRFTLLAEGWKVNEIILYRPLIYYLAFGEDNVFQQLRLSLESLGTVAQYDGLVLIYADRSQAELSAANPWLPAERLAVKPLPANDWIGFVAGKYCILEEAGAYQFQPVVYMDPDIIFNASIEPMLIEMAVSDTITAPIETFSGLEHAPSVGATLLQHDHEKPAAASGFNCGTLGIPNLRSQQHHLRLIRRVICNILSQRGRSALHWVDQEAANYVSYKLAHVETHMVSKFVRYGFELEPTPTEPMTGLVHFWGVSRHARPAIMREYLDRVQRRHALLTAADGGTGPAA